jgi:hypothetical protein
MLQSNQMTTSAARKQTGVDPDEKIIPLRLPRLPYHPSIPAKELRQAVSRVVKARQAREREAAVLEASSNQAASHENAQ